MYVDGEVIEKMIVTILEGFERIERKLDRMNAERDGPDIGALPFQETHQVLHHRPADILPQFRSTRVHEGARTEKISDKAHGIMLFGSAMRFVFVLTRELGSL